MRVVGVMLLAISACSFRPTTAASGDDGNGGNPPDASAGQVADAPIDSGPTRAACSALDPTGLVACFEFEDNFTDGTLLDSSTNHHDATTMGMSHAMRGTSDAATIGSSAKTYVPQSHDLDRATGYTIAMWIHPHTFPIGAADGLVDHEQQYAMAIVDSVDDGLLELRCIHTNVDHEYVAMTTSTSWSLVACTFDGAGNMCAHRFTSSSSHDSFCHGNAGTPVTTGLHGLAIGHLSDQGSPLDRFDGDLDSVQLYSRALSRADLCAIAAQPATCLD